MNQIETINDSARKRNKVVRAIAKLEIAIKNRLKCTNKKEYNPLNKQIAEAWFEVEKASIYASNDRLMDFAYKQVKDLLSDLPFKRSIEIIVKKLWENKISTLKIYINYYTYRTSLN